MVVAFIHVFLGGDGSVGYLQIGRIFSEHSVALVKIDFWKALSGDEKYSKKKHPSTSLEFQIDGC